MAKKVKKSTKPKKKTSSKSKKSSGDSSKLPSIVVVALGLAFFGYKFLTRETMEDDSTQQIQTVDKERNNQSTTSRGDINTAPAQKVPTDSPFDENGNLKNPEKTEVKEEKVVEVPEKFIDPLKKEQKEKIDKFQANISAEFKLPEDLTYANLDLDNGIEAIQGTGRGQIKKFSVLARKGVANPKQVAGYLNESDNGLSLGGVKFNSASAQKMTAPSSSGIKEVVIIPTNQAGVKAALLTRSDNQGSYVFIMDASTSFYESNEGFLDEMLSSFRSK